jgi:hypothetical protein
MTADDALWTPAALSRYLGIPVATLYQWRQRDESAWANIFATDRKP